VGGIVLCSSFCGVERCRCRGGGADIFKMKLFFINLLSFTIDTGNSLYIYSLLLFIIYTSNKNF